MSSKEMSKIRGTIEEITDIIMVSGIVLSPAIILAGGLYKYVLGQDIKMYSYDAIAAQSPKDNEIFTLDVSRANPNSAIRVSTDNNQPFPIYGWIDVFWAPPAAQEEDPACEHLRADIAGRQARIKELRDSKLDLNPLDPQDLREIKAINDQLQTACRERDVVIADAQRRGCSVEIVIDPVDDILPPPPPPDFSNAISPSPPQPQFTSLQVGEVVTVSIIMRNTGTTTWRAAEGYRLGSQSPQDNYTWGINRVELPNDVAPGAEVTFTFNITAPSVPGVYGFQWQMVHEWVEWFGSPTPVIDVQVIDAPPADLPPPRPVTVAAFQSKPPMNLGKGRIRYTITVRVVFADGAQEQVPDAVVILDEDPTPHEANKPFTYIGEWGEPPVGVVRIPGLADIRFAYEGL